MTVTSAMEEQTPRQVSREEMVVSGEGIEGKVVGGSFAMWWGFLWARALVRKWRMQHISSVLVPPARPPFPPLSVHLPPPPVLADFWMHDVRLCFCSTVAQGADYLAIWVFGRGKDNAAAPGASE